MHHPGFLAVAGAVLEDEERVIFLCSCFIAWRCVHPGTALFAERFGEIGVLMHGAVRHILKIPRIGRRAGNVEDAGGGIALRLLRGIDGVDHREVIDDEAVLPHTGGHVGHGEIPQALVVLGQRDGLFVPLAAQGHALGFGRAQAKGDAVVVLNIRRNDGRAFLGEGGAGAG